MAIPPNALRQAQPLDPADLLDYEVELLQSASTTALLEPGEAVASFTVALTVEAIEAGLRLKATGGYQTILLGGNVVKFWVDVDPLMRDDPRFGGAGVQLGVEITVTTTNVPPRIRQRTTVIQVAQQ